MRGSRQQADPECGAASLTWKPQPGLAAHQSGIPGAPPPGSSPSPTHLQPVPRGPGCPGRTSGLSPHPGPGCRLGLSAWPGVRSWALLASRVCLCGPLRKSQRGLRTSRKELEGLGLRDKSQPCDAFGVILGLDPVREAICWSGVREEGGGVTFAAAPPPSDREPKLTWKYSCLGLFFLCWRVLCLVGRAVLNLDVGRSWYGWCEAIVPEG